MYTGSACHQSKSLTAAMHDHRVNMIRDVNARVMTVKGRKMWCVIWCDMGWRIRMPVLLQVVFGERDWVGMTDMMMMMMMMTCLCISFGTFARSGSTLALGETRRLETVISCPLGDRAAPRVALTRHTVRHQVAGAVARVEGVRGGEDLIVHLGQEAVQVVAPNVDARQRSQVRDRRRQWPRQSV